MSHPEELEILETGKTGWDRFLDEDRRPVFDKGYISRSYHTRRKIEQTTALDVIFPK